MAVYSSSGGHILVDVAGYFTGAAQASALPPPKNVVPAGHRSCRAIVHIGDSTSVGPDLADRATDPG